jgi:hypothetical protein
MREMLTGIEVAGENIETGEDATRVAVDDFEGVHVSMAGEARCNGGDGVAPEWRCVHCDEPLFESFPRGVRTWLNANDDEDCYMNEIEDEEGNGEHGPHEPERMPLSWVNSASVRADDAADAVHVSISVGDPRGAFVMSVRRLDDGTLRLELPYEGMGFAHMPLKKVHEGVYDIGQ